MSYSINGAEKQLSKVFCKDYDFIIPPYQRPYSWEEEEAGELFDDLYEFFLEQEKIPDSKREGYFLGSIVVVKEEKKSQSEVIDGQQRLTTLTILMSAIVEFIEDASKKNIKAYILEEGNDIEKIPSKPRLTLRVKDKDFFKKYIQDFKIQELLKLKTSSLETDAQINIKQNAKVFSDKLNVLKKQNAKLKDFATFLVQNCYLVVVSTPSQDSAFRIFSVMNNRGKDLLPTDILKAELIGKIKKEDQDEYNDKWEEMEAKVGREDFSSLFNHIRMIYSKDKLRTTLLEGFKEKVIKEEKDSKKIIDDILNKYATAYYCIKEQNYKSSKQVSHYLKWLTRIPSSDWMPTAILVLSSNIDDKHIALFFKQLETLTAYLLITGKNINERILRFKVVLEEIEKHFKTAKGNKVFKSNSINLNSKEKKEFLNVLDGDIYLLTSPKKRYIVLRLDSFISDGGAIYDSEVLTIEHVLPQTVSANSQWAKDWPQKTMREEWVHRIGNLFPLNKGRNSKASNLDFDKKIKAYFDGPRKVSSYALTTQVIKKTKWTPDVVQKRQKELLEVFKENWEL